MPVSSRPSFSTCSCRKTITNPCIKWAFQGRYITDGLFHGKGNILFVLLFIADQIIYGKGSSAVNSLLKRKISNF